MCRAVILYAVRRLANRTHEISKPRSWLSKLWFRSENWHDMRLCSIAVETPVKSQNERTMLMYMWYVQCHGLKCCTIFDFLDKTHIHTSINIWSVYWDDTWYIPLLVYMMCFVPVRKFITHMYGLNYLLPSLSPIPYLNFPFYSVITLILFHWHFFCVIALNGAANKS